MKALRALWGMSYKSYNKTVREPRTPFWQLNRCIGHAHQKAKDENHQQQKACEMTLALVQGPKNQFEVWWNTPL